MAALVVAPQWIGDAVMTEPLLARLHARGERITVGALPWVAPVYRAMPQVAEVIEFPFRHGGLQWRERRALARAIEGRFARAYVLPNSIKSALLPLLAGIPVRIGYLGETRVGLLTHRLKNPPKSGAGSRPPMVAFYAALAGGDPGPVAAPRLSIDAAAVAWAAAAHGLTPGAYLVLAPGAEFGPAKRWPEQHVAALAAQWRERERQPVVLLGSGKEAPLCTAIAAQATRAAAEQEAAGPAAPPTTGVMNLAGQTSLDAAMALIAGARALVSNDSGLMHVAAALGVPQVAVFGSTSPHHTPPLNPRAQVVWLKDDASIEPPLDCAPCFQRECPLGHLRCLTQVTPAQVAGALRAALAAPAP